MKASESFTDENSRFMRNSRLRILRQRQLMHTYMYVYMYVAFEYYKMQNFWKTEKIVPSHSSLTEIDIVFLIYLPFTYF